MTDLSTYEALLADWRAKEEHAARMREFRDTGGEHRLQVAVVLADPVLATIVQPALNDLMKNGRGWDKLVGVAIHNAEKAAQRAKALFEGKTLDAAFDRNGEAAL